MIYITPQRPTVHINICQFLFEIGLSDNRTIIEQHSGNTQRKLVFEYSISFYDKSREHIITRIFHEIETPIYPESARFQNSQGKFRVRHMIDIPEYRYATMSVCITEVDGKPIDHEKLNEDLRKLRADTKGFGNIICNGGKMRIHKKTLSDKCRYFKQLFSDKRREYHVNCQLTDLMELVFCLAPFNRRITSGITFGALYRLSEIFKCNTIGDLCVRYIDSLMEYTPLLAGFIAAEGRVDDYSKLYVETKAKCSDEEIRELLRKEQYLRQQFYHEWHVLSIDYPLKQVRKKEVDTEEVACL